MNFQQCQGAPGTWIIMQGRATRYEPKQGYYGLYALGDLEDQTGRKEKMMFAGNEKSPLPQQSLLNVPSMYAVQWDANKQKFKAYFKSYCSMQGHTAPPPQRQQAPPRQGLQPNKDASIERQCAWKSACTVATSSSREFDLEETLRWAAAGLKFIETGQVPQTSDPGWPDNLPLGAPREPGEDEPPAADQPY